MNKLKPFSISKKYLDLPEEETDYIEIREGTLFEPIYVMHKRRFYVAMCPHCRAPVKSYKKTCDHCDLQIQDDDLRDELI